MATIPTIAEIVTYSQILQEINQPVEQSGSHESYHARALIETFIFGKTISPTEPWVHGTKSFRKLLNTSNLLPAGSSYEDYLKALQGDRYMLAVLWGNEYYSYPDKLIPEIPTKLLNAFFTVIGGSAATAWLLRRFNGGRDDFRYLTSEQIQGLNSGFTAFARGLVDTRDTSSLSDDNNLLMYEIIRNPPAWISALNAEKVANLLQYHAAVRAQQYADTVNEPHSASNWRLKGSFINALNPGAVEGIPVNSFLNVDVSTIVLANLQGVTGDQLLAADPASFQRLSATQIANLSAEKIGARMLDFCVQLTASQLQYLTDRQIVKLWSNVPSQALAEQAWARFSFDQKKALAVDRIDRLPNAIINKIALDDQQAQWLRDIDPMVMSNMSKDVLNGLSATAWSKFSGLAVAAIPASTVETLLPSVRANIGSILYSDGWWRLDGQSYRAQLLGQKDFELDSVTGARLWAPPPVNVEAADISPFVMAATLYNWIYSGQVGPTKRQFLNMTPEQYAAIWDGQFKLMPAALYRMNGSVPFLLRSAYQLSQTTAAEMSLLDRATLSALTASQIKVLPAEAIQALTPTQLSAIPSRELALQSRELLVSLVNKFNQPEYDGLKSIYAGYIAGTPGTASLDSYFKAIYKPFTSIFTNRLQAGFATLYHFSGTAFREAWGYQYLIEARSAEAIAAKRLDGMGSYRGYVSAQAAIGRTWRLWAFLGMAPVGVGNFINASKSSDPIVQALETFRGIDALAASLRIPVDLLVTTLISGWGAARKKLGPMTGITNWMKNPDIDALGKPIFNPVQTEEMYLVSEYYRNFNNKWGAIRNNEMPRATGAQFRGNAVVAGVGFIQDLALLGMAFTTWAYTNKNSSNLSGEEIAAQIMSSVGAISSGATFLITDWTLLFHGGAAGPSTSTALTDMFSVRFHRWAGAAIVVSTTLALASDLTRAVGQLKSANSPAAKYGAEIYVGLSATFGVVTGVAVGMMLAGGPLGLYGLLLVSILPNPKAIGEAEQLRLMMAEYRSTGRSTVADLLLQPLYENAALNATPLINFWSAAFTPAFQSRIQYSITLENTLKIIREELNYTELKGVREKTGVLFDLLERIKKTIAAEKSAGAGASRIDSERLFVGTTVDMSNFMLTTPKDFTYKSGDKNLLAYSLGYYVSAATNSAGEQVTSTNPMAADAPWKLLDSYSNSGGYSVVFLAATPDFVKDGKSYSVDASALGEQTNFMFVVSTSAVKLTIGEKNFNTYSINFKDVGGVLPSIVHSSAQAALLASGKPKDVVQALGLATRNWVVLNEMPDSSPVNIDKISVLTTVYGSGKSIDESSPIEVERKGTGNWITSDLAYRRYFAKEDVPDKLTFTGGHLVALVNGLGTTLTASNGSNAVFVALKPRIYNHTSEIKGGQTDSTHGYNSIDFTRSIDNKTGVVPLKFTLTDPSSYKAEVLAWDEVNKAYVVTGGDSVNFSGFNQIVGSRSASEWKISGLHLNIDGAENANYVDINELYFAGGVNTASIENSKYLSIFSNGDYLANSLVNITGSSGVEYNASAGANFVAVLSSSVNLHLGSKPQAMPATSFTELPNYQRTNDRIDIGGISTVEATLGNGYHKFTVDGQGGSATSSSSLLLHLSTFSQDVTEVVLSKAAQGSRAPVVKVDLGSFTMDMLQFGLGTDGVHVRMPSGQLMVAEKSVEVKDIEMIFSQNVETSGGGTASSANPYPLYDSFIASLNNDTSGFGALTFVSPSESDTPFTIGQIIRAFDNVAADKKIEDGYNRMKYVNYRDIKDLFTNTSAQNNVAAFAWERMQGQSFRMNP